MKILLDTHIFLSYISADRRLAFSVRDAILDGTNEVFLSAASVWEIIIKSQLGKLPLPEPAETYIPRERSAHLIASLPVDEDSVKRLARLPAHHRDPFDRLLVAQALEHGCKLATVDPQIRAYPVGLL
ncbi:MAG: type II toxin-antitoxin system VapC family toxin [Planctomycetes bacterium]|nr:type II toxin-antitoxin system VapC family toxin [Planctomycetota bacterium]